MNHLWLTLSALSLVGGALVVSPIEAATVDEKFLKTLPPEEQSLQDTVDHWGLPFSDQLRRFLSAREAFRSALGAQAPKHFMLGTQHALEKVPKTKYWFKGQYGVSVSIDAARNEHESVQIVVLPDIGKRLTGVTLAAADLHSDKGAVIPAQQITIYRVGYVQTQPARYPALYSGWWPDSLLPNAPIDIGGTDLGLFWVDVRVPRNAAPGTYQGPLVLKADGESVAVRVTLRVRDFTLPDRVPFPIAVWTSPAWPSGERMDQKDYRLLLAEFLRHGLDPISIGKQDVSLEKNDFRQFDENVEYCLARGLQRFEVPGPGRAPEKLRPLVEHLRQKRWIEKALVYSNRDEPDSVMFASENVPYYEKLHALFPDLRVFLASEYHPQIDRACDIWMTDLSTGKGPEFALKNRGKADVWFYYCHLPVRIDFFRPLVQAPNMEIDNDAVEHRLALWLAWKHQTPGMFIWAGNQEWSGKATGRHDWEKTGWRLPDRPSSFPYGGIHNGNGYLVYPGPCPSIRLKVLRDGLEDYGYLMELKRRASASSNRDLCARAARLLEVPAEVLVDAHYFNRDPAGLARTRTAMADCIEALGR
jgi:hypothetical protein